MNFFSPMITASFSNFFHFDIDAGSESSAAAAPENKGPPSSQTGIGPSSVIKDFRGHGASEAGESVGHGSSDIIDKQDAGGEKSHSEKETKSARKEESSESNSGSSSEGGATFVDNVSSVGTVQGKSIESGESNHTGHIVPVVPVGAISETTDIKVYFCSLIMVHNGKTFLFLLTRQRKRFFSLN